MPTLEETTRELKSAYVERFKALDTLPERYRSKWDLISESTKYQPASYFESRLLELRKVIAEVVTAVHLVDKHLEQSGDDEALIQKYEEIPNPLIRRLLQDSQTIRTWPEVHENLYDLYEGYCFLHECYIAAALHLSAGEEMPSFDSLRKRRQDLERVAGTLERKSQVTEEIANNVYELRDLGVEVRDEQAILAQALAEYFDTLPRQIEAETDLFVERLNAEYERACLNPQPYEKPSSDSQWLAAVLKNTNDEVFQRIEGIEMLTRCLEMNKGDSNRGSILQKLASNPQVEGLMITMGTSPQGLREIRKALQQIQLKWQFEASCMSLIRGAIKKYGKLPRLNQLMEEIERLLEVDLGVGPAGETAKYATDRQLQSLKKIHQLLQLRKIQSKSELTEALGSEKEANKHVKAVKRLCVNILQKQFDQVSSSRPDHYRGWSGGIQRMVKDLWKGEVAVDM